jgi:hypothetical protein
MKLTTEHFRGVGEGAFGVTPAGTHISPSNRRTYIKRFAINGTRLPSGAAVPECRSVTRAKMIVGEIPAAQIASPLVQLL